MSTAELRCIFASLPHTTRGRPIILGEDPKGENFLYCNGPNVYIRDIECASKCDIYCDHQQKPTVAKYSPSRFYICSGDSIGKIRIWDTVNAEHILKNEFHVLGDAVKDVAWSPDNTKLAVVGDGKTTYAKIITSDSGNSVGELGGHGKCINAVAYKPKRPFRIATASEDQKIHFYEGPPFKYKRDHQEHTNFVNCIKYHPNGDVFVSGGADGMALVFDGATSELIGGLGGEKAHAGGIYGLDFSPDGSEVLTVCGDRTAKIWNLQSKECVVEFKFGKDLNDMQVGCLWQGDNIITVSLSGYINYLDRNNPSTPRRIQKGHNKAILTMALTQDKSTIYTGGVDGLICGWNANTGECEEIHGEGHSNQITDMKISGDMLITVAWDDTIRYTSLSANAYGSDAAKLPSQPASVAAVPGSSLAVVVCLNHLVVVDGGNVVFQQEVRYEPTAVDIHPNRTTVAIGAKADKHVHFFELEDTTLRGVQKIHLEDDVTDVKFSPDGAYLAITSGANKFLWVYQVGDKYEELYKIRKQTGRLETIAWSPDSQHLATGSLDGTIVVWGLDKHYTRTMKVMIIDAHRKSHVHKLLWLSDNNLVSVSNDSCVKQWTFKFDD